jgi:Cu2+-exporting ATPase
MLAPSNHRAIPYRPIDDSRYHVGYGIVVSMEGHTVRVGSKRFMGMESIELPDVVRQALEEGKQEGSTLVVVGVDRVLRGAIELQESVRPEVRSMIGGRREWGIKHVAIIPGVHDGPIRKLAGGPGMDQYFAQVLPAEKAE